MALCSHNKCHCSAHIRQFVNKSSCIDRSAFTDDSEPNVESLIENLKGAIMKELSMPCVARSSASLSAPSAAASQSPTPAPVSDSSAPATPVPVTLTSATSGFAISAFMTSSPHFKKMLYRLNESHLSM
ncbi:hypothetical protein BDFG_01735 [Blastomyces dermatitidis ATCC 26199]|nr:hypothetical protein BDFG_01735 [Blastomyces dermatitidis ATCC 26199]